MVGKPAALSGLGRAPLDGNSFPYDRRAGDCLGLAEIQLKRTSDRLTVIYLLDQSMSIPEEQRRTMIDYVNHEVREHRKSESEDRAGVIVFGREAAIEYPPFDDDIAVPATIESRIETDFTNLAGAIKLAQATLPKTPRAASWLFAMAMKIWVMRSRRGVWRRQE